MKQLIVLGSLFISSLAFQACGGDKKEAAATPVAVVSAFNAKYPAATEVTWETESVNDSTHYDAVFKNYGKKTDAEFDENGNFIKEK